MIPATEPAVPGLPSEIYLAIFEHLRSTRDLSSIALACCLFSRLARPLIYRDIIAPTTNTPRLLSLLTTLAADRALAHAVRRFHLVHGPEHGFLTGILHIDSEIVALVLLAMDNLIELEIGLPNDVPWDMLRMCSFRLREFTLHGATADAEQLLQFLEHQEDLIALQMRQAELSTQPLKPILPALRRFVGRSATARQIWLNAPRFPAEMVLTNEAVTGTFSWLGQVMDDRIIEDLKIHIAFPPTVFRAFPSEVSCVKSLSVTFGRLPEFLFLSTPWYLGVSLFKNLRTFALHGTLIVDTYEPVASLSMMYGLPAVIQTEEIYLESVTAMHRVCPSLEEVSLPKMGQPNLVFRRTTNHWYCSHAS